MNDKKPDAIKLDVTDSFTMMGTSYCQDNYMEDGKKCEGCFSYLQCGMKVLSFEIMLYAKQKGDKITPENIANFFQANFPTLTTLIAHLKK